MNLNRILENASLYLLLIYTALRLTVLYSVNPFELDKVRNIKKNVESILQTI
jgi:hypothetical protein